MTKVDFYTGAGDKLRAACHLSHLAVQEGLRVMLCTPDKPTTESMDQLLWHYPPTSFMPHCRNDGLTNDGALVVVGHCEEAFSHNEVMVSLHTACLPFFSRFERVLEVVGRDPEDIRFGRERFAFYRDRGYKIRHFDFSTMRGC